MAGAVDAMCMSRPKVPAMPAMSPAASVLGLEDAGALARRRERSRAASRRGRSSTILTSGRGAGTPTTVAPTLLGG